MTQQLWTDVDRYITDALVPSDPILDAVLKSSLEAGLPAINVAPNQGKLLMLLAQIQKSRTILEIGTLGGYSTIWLARALPVNGRLITLEIDAEYAKVAKDNIERANLSDVIEVRLGKALDTLSQIADEGLAPFDLIFIDADKPSNSDYFMWALRLSRPGSLIIIDNVVRNGAVIDASSTDPRVIGVRRLNELLAAEKRITATAIQTVGSKGYDGFTIALVTS
jgi:predicted O-methyltransferase YrrM